MATVLVTVDITAHCGCGFNGTVEEAVQHCGDAGHTLTVLGTIHRE